jgi:hypothetical protein
VDGFGCIQQQNFIEADPFVSQKVGRMGADNYLFTRATLHARKHLR